MRGSARSKPAAPVSRAGCRSLILGAVLVGLGILALVGYLVYSRGTSHPPVASSRVGPTPTEVTLAQRIDGIPCNTEDITYHQHAHLDIFIRGHQATVPSQIGINDDLCLYWLHTHDNSGEIHMEAPAAARFTLGEFFDIWHQPLSRTQVLTATVSHGESERVIVDGHTYLGDPRSIVLRRHRLVTIEIGPPFEQQQPFDFQGD